MTSGERARITFERSGGFAGITVAADVDTAELPEEEAAEFRSILSGLDLSELPRPPAGRGGQPDRFQYDIRIEQGDRVYLLSYAENELPPQLKPLVHRLTKRANPSRD
jgi:hypothetical protein